MKRVLICFGVLLLAGCIAPKLDAEYIVRPWVQHTEADRSVDSLKTIIGWAIEADTTHWGVVSYEDAIGGKVTNFQSGETRTSEVEGIKYGDGWSLNYHFKKKPVIVIVADTTREFYAYHEAVVYGGTPRTIISIVKQEFLADTTMRQGVWKVFYGAAITDEIQ